MKLRKQKIHVDYNETDTKLSIPIQMHYYAFALCTQSHIHTVYHSNCCALTAGDFFVFFLFFFSINNNGFLLDLGEAVLCHNGGDLFTDAKILKWKTEADGKHVYFIRYTGSNEK